jgi:hypothetical protein
MKTGPAASRYCIAPFVSWTAPPRNQEERIMVFPHVQYLGPAHPAGLRPPAGPHADDAAVRELDSRTSDGIHVRLLWHSGHRHVSVAVHDTRTGDAFELTVRDGDRALDVFHHPFAYAARRPASYDGGGGEECRTCTQSSA